MNKTRNSIDPEGLRHRSSFPQPDRGRQRRIDNAYPPFTFAVREHAYPDYTYVGQSTIKSPSGRRYLVRDDGWRREVGKSSKGRRKKDAAVTRKAANVARSSRRRAVR